MAMKPNYNQQRAERNRAKQAKQDAKRLEQEAQKAERRRAREAAGEPPADGDAPHAENPDATQA